VEGKQNMKFATIGHLIDEKTIDLMPKPWIGKKYIVSPEMDIKDTKGHLIILKKTDIRFLMLQSLHKMN